jgi:tetratricopeptide (TPR) repeat protein
MRPAFTPLLMIPLLWAASVRADPGDDGRDAPVGTNAPATIGWRVPVASVGGAGLDHPPLMSAGVSVDLLSRARQELAAEPDSRFKGDAMAALVDLDAGAARLPPEARQSWIDAHLGTLNETVRTAGPDAPGPTMLKAAKAAARLNASAEHWQDSASLASKALEYDPDDRDALISRSQANAGLADFARAYADAERAAKVAPNSAEAFTARAAAAYGLGNYLQAVEDARRAVALDPENKTAFQLMKLSEGRTRKLSDFENKPAPQLADSVEREYHGMIQQLNQAEERRMAPVETPGMGVARRFDASAANRFAVKDYWGAIDDADKALASDPTDARALYVRATAHNLIGEYGDAVRDATRGLTVAPSDTALHDARSWAYNRMGRYADAMADAHASMEVDPKDAYAMANRAYAEEQRGDFPAMAEDYKVAAALSPQFESTYADAARRHGLTPQPVVRGRRGADLLTPKQQKQARSFAAIIFSSLLGGLLIAFGIMHVSSSVKERDAPPPLRPGVPSTGFEASYELGKSIGQGGMGIVYEATDRKLGRAVAVKMLRDEFKLDDSAKAGFMAEARTVAELHHPSIVDIHNIVEDDRGLYLIFERLEGRTLDQIIWDRKRLPLSEVKRILKPVCEALEYAHAHDVVHRDLKPANVMLTKDGGVKVLDFGISRHAARAGAKASTTQTITGTPHYMAPEQEYGFVQKENDVFSLGAVLYEMVTGVRPYEGSHQAKLAKGYIRVSTRVPGAPLDLDVLIDRSLEPDPEKRIPSPGQFWLALAAIPDFVSTDEA